jgi:proline iminopeptidase
VTRVDVGGGIALNVREAGAGPPVVLLHPGPGLDGSVFFPWLEPLAERLRLLAVDLRAHGRSDSGDPAEWTVARLAADVEALAGALDLEDWTLLGHSFGGRVALQHAVDFPGSASRLIAACTFAQRDMERIEAAFEAWGTPEQRASVEAAFEREEEVASAKDCRAAWRGQMPFFLAQDDDALADALLDGVEFGFEISRRGVEGAAEDLRPRLGEARSRTLVLAGERDRITSVEDAREIAAGIAGAELRILAGVAHFPFAERPDAYLEAVAAFAGG